MVVRLGIIGFGAEGGMYTKLLTEGRVPQMSLGAICDIDESKRAGAEAVGVPFFVDYLLEFLCTIKHLPSLLNHFHTRLCRLYRLTFTVKDFHT